MTTVQNLYDQMLHIWKVTNIVRRKICSLNIC